VATSTTERRITTELSPITTRQLTLDPKFAAAYSGRANAYHGKKDYDRAIADYDKAITLDPKLVAAYGGRGLLYRAKGDYGPSHRRLRQGDYARS